LDSLPKWEHHDLLVGIETHDDAGVYRLRDDLAVVQTLDLITPLVDDPFTFGQIAAANSLSDVYAMGGQPVAVMNILAIDPCLDLSIPREILRGAAEKVKEAGAVMLGGHSVEDQELKFGLSVTGIVHPDKVIRNTGARPGDSLILTKPLGTGIVSTAIKAGTAPKKSVEEAVAGMTTLNRDTARLAAELGAHAMTDITGFGLLGHALEMLRESDIDFTIFSGTVPTISGTIDLIHEGMVPGGTQRNRDHLGERVLFDNNVFEELILVLCDAQTSGGLLIALPSESALPFLRKSGETAASVIGEVTSGSGRIRVIL